MVVINLIQERIVKMKASNEAASCKQRLENFINQICPSKANPDDNDNPVAKSRWAKWQFTKNGTNNQIEFHQLEKSESKIINRLLDRLDPSAGKARHAARCEILKLLEKNGIEITDDIKKYLPDNLKLGNINALGESIQAANLEKVQKQSDDIDDFKKLIEQHVSDTVSTGQINSFLRNSSDDVSKKSKEILIPEFKPILIDFSENLLKELSLMTTQLSEEEFTQLLNEKFENFYNEIIKSDFWKKFHETTLSSIKSELNKLEIENEITLHKKNYLKEQFDQLLDCALMFAGISNFSSLILSDYQEDFKNLIKRLVNVGNDENKVQKIFLTNIVSGLTTFLKNNAMKK
jgi:hypothetical protein